jgi:hypothetical protein
MISSSILTRLCAAEFAPGDSAYLVAWADGHFGIVRNNQLVGQQRWGRSDMSECAKAFLNYVRLVRRKLTRAGRSELPAA